MSYKDRAYAHIRQKMLAGGIGAGDKLSEVVLAKEIGVSRTPVREAMSQLEVEGLVEQVPRYGTFVRKLSRHEVHELYEIRELLEGYAAARAAERITPEQAAELQRLCDSMHDIVRTLRDTAATHINEETIRRWVLTDVAFHMLIVRISGSGRVAKIVSDFRILTNLCGHRRSPIHQTELGVHAWTWGWHVRILRALKRRDAAKAQALVTEHIRRAKVASEEHFDREEAAACGNLPDPLGEDWPDSVRRMISQMERYKR